MKILLYGATGMIGSRILSEALRREHQVTAVVRNPKSVHSGNSLLIFVVGDILDPQNVAKYAAGQDAVAVALIDELESPKHIKQRFTVGY